MLSLQPRTTPSPQQHLPQLLSAARSSLSWRLCLPHPLVSSSCMPCRKTSPSNPLLPAPAILFQEAARRFLD